MNRARMLTATLALCGLAAFGTLTPAGTAHAQDPLLEYRYDGVNFVFLPATTLDFTGPTPASVVRIAVPPAWEVEDLAANRTEEGVTVQFEADEDLGEVYAYYRETLREQGFELLRDARLAGQDSIVSTWERRDDRFVLTVTREGGTGESLYRVFFGFEPVTPAAQRAPLGGPVRAAAPTVGEFNRTPFATFRQNGVLFGFFGPRELTGLRERAIVRLAVPTGVAEETLEVNRVEEGVRVKFESDAELGTVFEYYRDLLVRQGFELVEREEVEDDKLRAVFRRGENLLAFNVEREGGEEDSVYDVLFNFSPEEAEGE